MAKKIRLNKRSVKNKISLFGKAVDFPSEIFDNCAHINLLGNKELSVDGCFGIVGYSECEAKINIGKQVLCITGCKLEISDYTESSITVRGTINAIEFSNGG